MNRRRLVALPGATLLTLVICDLILLARLPIGLQSWAAVGLTVLLPGLLLVNWLLDSKTRAGMGERFVFGVGAGFGLLVVLMLALSYLPGGLRFAEVLVTFNLLLLVLLVSNVLVFCTSYRTFPLEWNRVDWNLVTLAALLIGAAFLRFTHIDYSEFHGDEAVVALRANDVIQGWERALFIHKKGPGEILIGTAMYVLMGELTEFAAHLPFALASWTGVLAVYLLGKRWFGPVAGWWAGAMVAVDGYLMAFGRMLQYQSIVFLMTVLTVLAIERARQRSEAMQRYFLLAALLLATGVLAHYEGVMAIVPAGVLLIAFWQQEGGNLAATKRMARWLAWPLLLFAVICAAFYIPYVLDPEFWRDTIYYILCTDWLGKLHPKVWRLWSVAQRFTAAATISGRW